MPMYAQSDVSARVICVSLVCLTSTHTSAPSVVAQHTICIHAVVTLFPAGQNISAAHTYATCTQAIIYSLLFIDFDLIWCVLFSIGNGLPFVTVSSRVMIIGHSALHLLHLMYFGALCAIMTGMHFGFLLFQHRFSFYFLFNFTFT